MARVNESILAEFSQHFSTKMSQDMVDYVTEVVFKWSRYIFTWRQGKQQYGYCTHCKHEFKTNGLKHNKRSKCPECQSSCEVKASGLGRKNMVDVAYFVYYEKSLINPHAIVARGIYVARDYSQDFRKTETVFKVVALYVFEPGNSRMISRYAYYAPSDPDGMGIVGYWEQRKTVRSQVNTAMRNIASYCSQDSIKDAVKGTPFQYSTWESYKNWDMVEFFDLYAKYPCIEYLTKLGMKELVTAKLGGYQTHGAIHWRGSSLSSVLRLPKRAIKEVVAQKISSATLRLYQLSFKDKSNFSLKEIKDMNYNLHVSEVQKILKYTTFRKMHAYVQKQYQRKNANKRYRAAYQVLHTWRDYINDCVELEMDLRQDSILFPSDLHKAHQDTIAKVKSQADALLNEKIRRRAKSLENYRFEANGFILRPAQDANEVIREGNALHHCVGSYARKYGNGRTNIFVIRKTSNPDDPFYTMEVKGNRIIQTYGFKHCLPNKEVKAFIDAFEQEKLTIKQNKKKKGEAA
ncbi:PcfJ domain-containing protein [Brevibacillus porteri]|uniref:PcfJ domain-containing protein n=1 Tax=Brevibacillus porteri TaxID=2126350 RepID=UPI003D20CC0D